MRRGLFCLGCHCSVLSRSQGRQKLEWYSLQVLPKHCLPMRRRVQKFSGNPNYKPEAFQSSSARPLHSHRLCISHNVIALSYETALTSSVAQIVSRISIGPRTRARSGRMIAVHSPISDKIGNTFEAGTDPPSTMRTNPKPTVNTISPANRLHSVALTRDLCAQKHPERMADFVVAQADQELRVGVRIARAANTRSATAWLRSQPW